MRTLINRNQETTSFIEIFNKLANDYVSKLTFTSREEYLAWVKQWKEEFKIVEMQHKLEKWNGGKTVCVLPHKIDAYEKKLATVISFTPEQSNRLIDIQAKYALEFNVKPCFICSHHLLWYMLIIRKSGKILAGKQMQVTVTV